MTEFVTISGEFHPDGRFEWRPGYSENIDKSREFSDGLAAAEVANTRGEILGRWSLSVLTYTDSGSNDFTIRGCVPLPEGATVLRIIATPDNRSARRVVTEQQIPSSVPLVRFTTVPSGRAAGRIRLGWQSSGTPEAVEYLVQYSVDNGTHWIPASSRLNDHEAEVDLDQMPGGAKCVFRVMASNGVRSGSVVSEPFTVELKRCRSFIVHPRDGGAYGREVLLSGNGWWLEGDRPELEQLTWSSDVDGLLGRGRTVVASLSPGEHHITLAAGADERAGSSDVRIVVSGAP